MINMYWCFKMYLLFILIFDFPNIATPVETGRIQDSELVEASGLVASHRFPGIYYSIQDSLNPDKVYAMKYNGEAIGNKKNYF